ncbi:MAG: gliding motility-associated C-terminal domain-containing protein, partial [Bacteroidota bacterium]
ETGSVSLSDLPAGNWTINPGSIAGNTTNTTITGLLEGTYNFTVTNDEGCTSLVSSNIVINKQPPTPESPIAQFTQASCTDSTGTITIISPLGAGMTYSIDGLDYTNTTGVFISVIPGIYSITAMNSNGCISTSSDLIAELIDCIANLSVTTEVNNDYPSIGSTVVFTILATNSGPDDATGVIVTVHLQDGYTYISSTTSTETYVPSSGIWAIGTMSNGTSEILTLTVKVNQLAAYSNTVNISGNENDENMINNFSSTITYPVDFSIPEGFSPNGDGINDVFVIRGIQNYPDNSFVIFNRWGNKVFESSPYQNTWDGKPTKAFNIGDDELPVGTYFYILDLGDGSEIINGTIYLNR